MVIEGAILGAVIGGGLGAHGHGTVMLRRVAKGTGLGAVVGGAVGAGFYALEKAVTRGGGAQPATPSNDR